MRWIFCLLYVSAFYGKPSQMQPDVNHILLGSYLHLVKHVLPLQMLTNKKRFLYGGCNFRTHFENVSSLLIHLC